MPEKPPTPGFAAELIDDEAWEAMQNVSKQIYTGAIAATMKGGLHEFYARLTVHVELHMACDEVSRDEFANKEYYEVIGARWAFDHIDEAPDNFNKELFLEQVEQRFQWRRGE